MEKKSFCIFRRSESSIDRKIFLIFFYIAFAIKSVDRAKTTRSRDRRQTERRLFTRPVDEEP